MDKIIAVFKFYTIYFNAIPDSARLLIALAVFIVIGIVLVRFIKKSVIWFVVIIILIPATAPAAVTIYQAIFQKWIEPILR